MAADGVVVEPGDMLLLHTGFATKVLEWDREPDPAEIFTRARYLDAHDEALLDWIADSQISALVADNYAVEGLLGKDRDPSRHSFLPIHHLCLFKLGVPLGELWYLARAGDVAARARPQPVPAHRSPAAPPRHRRLPADPDRHGLTEERPGPPAPSGCGRLCETAAVRVQVLGGLRVVSDDVDVDLGSPKQRMVLAVSPCPPPRRCRPTGSSICSGPITIRTRPPSGCRATSNLRRVLDPDRSREAGRSVVVREFAGYRLDATVDLAELEAAVDAAVDLAAQGDAGGAVQRRPPGAIGATAPPLPELADLSVVVEAGSRWRRARPGRSSPSPPTSSRWATRRRRVAARAAPRRARRQRAAPRARGDGRLPIRSSERRPAHHRPPPPAAPRRRRPRALPRGT